MIEAYSDVHMCIEIGEQGLHYSDVIMSAMAFVQAQMKENIKAQMASNAENVSIWWRHHVIAPGKPEAIDWTNAKLF